MVTDAFGSLLEEMGKALKIPKLQPDRNNSCLIKFPNGTQVQLELDRSALSLIIGCDLGSVPPGRYRENVFREALIANGMPHPRHGDFAYSKQSDHLVLFENIAIKDLSGEKIADEIKPFIEKAQSWKESIERGEIPSHLPHLSSSSKGSGMFGLR